MRSQCLRRPLWTASLWVLLLAALVQSIDGQPFVYPNPSKNNGSFIYNHVLVELPCGLSNFFCANCPQSVAIYTPNDSLELVVNWLNRNGYAVTVKEPIQIEVENSGRYIIDPAETRASAAILEVALSDYSPAVRFELSSGEVTRSFMLIKDETPPSVQIELLNETETDQWHEYFIQVTFSERVVWDSAPVECDSFGRLRSRENRVTAMLNASAACTNNLLEKSIADGVSVKGGTSLLMVTENSQELHVVVQTTGKNSTADVEIEVLEGFTDFAGNPLRETKRRIFYYRPFPPPRQRQERLLRRDVVFPVKKRFSGKAAGQAATVAVAAASSASLATSAATGGSGSGASITMLNNVQRLHMTGMLAVTRLPPSYQNFTGEVGWAVLDMQTPWENSNRTKSRNGTRTSQRQLKVVEAAFELQDDESEFQYFERMMFWVPALFVVIIILHMIIIAWFVIKERPLPDMLQPPRIELMLAFFCLPPVSIAAAGLYKGSRWRAMLGTWLLVTIPGLFLSWNFYMLWFYVLRLPPHLREVNLIMDIPNKKQKALKNVRKLVFRDGQKVKAVTRRQMRPGESISSGIGSMAGSSNADPVVVQMASREPSTNAAERRETMHAAAVMEEADPHQVGATTTEEEPKAASCGEIMNSISNMTFMTLLFGEHQDEAEWITTKTQGSKFNARYGFLFEEHRGPAIGRRDVTLSVDPITGQVDRGELVILRERPLVTVPYIARENSHFHLKHKHVYRYHLQMMTKLLDITKTILVGCIVAGVGDTDDNVSSIVALIALSLILILLLRIAKPFPSRLDMLMLLLAEVADLIVYTCALFLVLGPNTTEDTDDQIGMALLLSEAFALIATILEYALISIGLGMGAFEEWQNRNEAKFFKLVHALMMQNELYLQKKYFDRWMVRALCKGLNGRIPARHELKWQRAVKIYLKYSWSGVTWLWTECKQIVCDAQNKWIRKQRRDYLHSRSITAGRRDLN